MKMKKVLAVFTAIMMILCSISTTAFAQQGTLQDAVNAGGTITLTNDVYLTSTVIVPEGVNATLDLNGYNVTVAKNGARSLYAIDNYGTFTLTDSVGTGSITARGIENFAEMTVNGGKIVSCDSNGGAAIWNEGNLTINNGTFEAPYVGSAEDFSGPGCLNIQSGASAVINNGTFTSYNNRTYAVISYGDLTIENASVTGAHGAICADAGSTTIKNGTYSIANSNNGSDHAIYTSGGSITITGGLFDGTKGYSTIYNEGGKVVVSGGTYAEAISSSFIADGYKFDAATGKVVSTVPALPTATVTELTNNDLTFALNFKADEVTKEQLDYYGDWYADFVFTVNKDITFNANDATSDGYLSGQYDAYSENWVNVPFENVSLEANTALRVLTYALEGKLTEYKTPLTYNDVYSFVKEFNCGVFFNPKFLANNPDLNVTLELRMYNPDVVGESYVIGKTYVFNGVEANFSHFFDEATGTLTISGSGPMPNYTGSNPAPWREYNDSIKAIEISEGITTIGNQAFATLKNVEEITIPESVTYIGNFAFLNSTGIKTLNIAHVNEIGTSAFTGCDNLEAVNFEGTIAEYKALREHVSANIPFLRATTTITDNGNVAGYAGMSLYATWLYNAATKTVEINNCPTKDAHDMLNYNSVTVAPWADYDVVNVVIDGVSSVGSRSFYGDASVKNATLGETVSAINTWAFFNTKLDSIKLPAALTRVGTGAFYNVKNVNVESTATRAQYEGITFGTSNLDFTRSTVILEDAVKGWHSSDVNWYVEGTTLYITGTGDMAALNEDQPWEAYKDTITNIVIADGITALGKQAFANFKNVTEITIPDSVTEIRVAVFDGMSNLTTVTLPASLETIGTCAFRGCNKLATVNFAGNVADLTIGSGNSAIAKFLK